MITSASFNRDANYVPITTDGLTSNKSVTLSASNTTASVALFGITGTIEVRALYGVVTTVFGANHTAAHFRLNDQTATPAISLATGVTLSNASAGSVISRGRLAATAAAFIDASAARITEASAVNLQYFSPFLLTQKTGGVLTTVDYRYTTTETPTTGAVQFFITWLPKSADANVVVQ